MTARSKIETAYKRECKAAWEVMDKRVDRALRKRDRELAKLTVIELASMAPAATVGKPKRSKPRGTRSRS